MPRGTLGNRNERLKKTTQKKKKTSLCERKAKSLSQMREWLQIMEMRHISSVTKDVSQSVLFMGLSDHTFISWVCINPKGAAGVRGPSLLLCSAQAISVVHNANGHQKEAVQASVNKLCIKYSDYIQQHFPLHRVSVCLCEDWSAESTFTGFVATISVVQCKICKKQRGS